MVEKRPQSLGEEDYITVHQNLGIHVRDTSSQKLTFDAHVRIVHISHTSRLLLKLDPGLMQSPQSLDQPSHIFDISSESFACLCLFLFGQVKEFFHQLAVYEAIRFFVLPDLILKRSIACEGHVAGSRHNYAKVAL